MEKEPRKKGNSEDEENDDASEGSEDDTPTLEEIVESFEPLTDEQKRAIHDGAFQEATQGDPEKEQRLIEGLSKLADAQDEEG